MTRSGMLVTVLAGLAILARTGFPSAHEIPTEVTVHAFVRPEGHTLRLLVRVPLKAMRDVNFPTRGPGFLDLSRADATLRDAAVVWIGNGVTVYEDDRLLGAPSLVSTRVSLPSDRSFVSYADALAHVSGARLSEETEIPWDQAVLDSLFEYRIESDRARFSIDPEFARLGLRVTTVLRLLPPDGSERAFEYVGDPGTVRLDPRWHQAANQFAGLGFRHILDGTDHLLFLLCLVIPFRRLRPLVLIVTSFTVAHSITLIASAYGAAPDSLWFVPLIETVIAASIVYMALENIVSGGRFGRRWAIAFAFGLVHGFGFSFALRDTMQFAGLHLLTSLVFFNVGVELGQVLVLLLLVPMLQVLFRFVVAERMGTIVLSAVVAHTGWHWMVDRGAQLMAHDLPELDAAFAATSVRWAMIVVGAGGVWWVASNVRSWLQSGNRRADSGRDGPRASAATQRRP